MVEFCDIFKSIYFSEEHHMALISIIKDFRPKIDYYLISKANELTPTLKHKIKEPVGGFKLKERYSQEKNDIELESLSKLSIGKGENLCLDFGEHLVGYPTFELSFSGSHPDAPAYIKLKFAENFKELSENSSEYNGWLSSSWIQEEYVHVDIIPSRLVLHRRFAFRYVKITMLDTSPKYKLIINHAECRTESSADWHRVKMPEIEDKMLSDIYNVSLKTLANCMQEVMEDGPKRDRRLWVGDMRLQALTNYISFRNNNLVKRCLYIFGGSRFPDGRVSANAFVKPNIEADDTYLFDYAQMYVACLEEYLEETGDDEALKDLSPIAFEQIEYGLSHISNGLPDDEIVKATFIDWNEKFDKSACALAVMIYSLDYGISLAHRAGDEKRAEKYAEVQKHLRAKARELFWDNDKNVFVSGGQAVQATQIWMVLAEVITGKEAAELMRKVPELGKEVSMDTPYMHHYYVMAMIKAGLKDEATEYIKWFWGGMIKAGADTFWECWDGKNEDVSPYGGSMLNSYCHAWSCTPAYIIKKYLIQN